MGLFGSPNVAKLEARKDVAALVDLLESKDEALRATATASLVRLGPEATALLCAALATGSENARGKFVPAPAHRARAAAKALGEIGAPRSVIPLCEAASEWESMVGGTDVVEAANAALDRLGAAAVDELCAALGGGAPATSVKCMVARRLAEFADDRAIDALCGALKDEECDVRVAVAELLGRSLDDRAVEPLCAALDQNESDSYSCEAAMMALVELGASAVEPLCAALQQEEPPHYVAIALGKIGDARAIDPLLKALDHWDLLVRDAAAQALEQIGGPDVERSRDRIVKVLANLDPEVDAAASRDHAVNVLVICHYHCAGDSQLARLDMVEPAIRARGFTGPIAAIETIGDVPDASAAAKIFATKLPDMSWRLVDVFTAYASADHAAKQSFAHTIGVFEVGAPASTVNATQADHLAGMLIIFNKEFSPMETFVTSILTKMTRQGRPYQDWMTPSTPMATLVHPDAQNPYTFLAVAMVEFRRRLGVEPKAETIESATFEGSFGIVGTIVTQWGKP